MHDWLHQRRVMRELVMAVRPPVQSIARVPATITFTYRPGRVAVGRTAAVSGWRGCYMGRGTSRSSFYADEAPWNYMMATAIVYALPPVVLFFALRRWVIGAMAPVGVRG